MGVSINQGPYYSPKNSRGLFLEGLPKNGPEFMKTPETSQKTSLKKASAVRPRRVKAEYGKAGSLVNSCGVSLLTWVAVNVIHYISILRSLN